MEKMIGLTIGLASACLWMLTSVGPALATGSGVQLFQQHCSACHPNGNNIINPKKTLHQADREANKIYTAENIIDKMRHPGPWMATFTPNTISDDDAKAIAEYILKTF
jgi:cytochrome c6